MMASVGMIHGVYAPILPSMLDHKWLTKSQAGYWARLPVLHWLVDSLADGFAVGHWSADFSAFFLPPSISVHIGWVDVDYSQDCPPPVPVC